MDFEEVCQECLKNDELIVKTAKNINRIYKYK